MKRIIMVLALGLAFATSALAETGPAAKDLSVDDNDQKISHVCDGGEVTINGNTNTITLTGDCANVVVNGNSNTVTLDASFKRLVVNGNKNTVAWSAKHNKKKPTVLDVGNKNTLTKTGT
jgi:formylmethanofuran dehydrogenase subunit C